MIERPILFSASMVQAILAGNKTQTRRVAQNVRHPDLGNWYTPGALVLEHEPQHVIERACPYGEPGDQLWVRETWQGPLLDEDQREVFRQDGSDAFKKPEFCAYRATDTLAAIDDDGNELGWRPSIHMPRWASRIQLEITAIRIERLQDISEEDAKAEGADCLISDNVTPETRAMLSFPLMENGSPYRNGFAHLWELINGDDAWDKNPWVWVIEFRRIERNQS